MVATGRITFMQMRLSDDDRPISIGAANFGEDASDGILLQIHGPHHRDGAMADVTGDFDILAWIVVRLTKPPRIEKPDNWQVLGKIINLRSLRTGFVARADLRTRNSS